MTPVAYIYVLGDGANLVLCPECFSGGECDGELYAATADSRCGDCGRQLDASGYTKGHLSAQKYYVSVDNVVVVDAVKRRSMMTYRDAMELSADMRVVHPESNVTVTRGWHM